ncbi:acyl-CoA desaturase [Lentisalinibacter orientalis]|uniref:acyl-CoA desaturase n=1 Tax=Lentisalinibacter orientalis TaxID=2992241 RepID=UPI00386A3E20
MTAAQKQARAVLVGMGIFHLGCLGAFWTGVSPAALTAALILYLVRGFGITAGYHRLLAHRSFRAGRPVQFMLALAGSLATQGGPLWWVAHHRSHHRYTETDRDIHSPRTQGFWRSHMGWMLSAESFRENGANARDLYRVPELKFLQQHYVWIVLGQGAAIYALGAGLAALGVDTSGAQMLVWAWFIATVALWHATFMVNSVCHLWGSRPFDAGDTSTNNWLVAALALGEGWHNNHHKFAYSARHGLEWWQFDLTWVLLRGMERLGLISDVRLPRRRMLERARAAAG